VSPRVQRFPRFDRVERVVHWTNATLFLVLLFTGASLYLPALSTVVANRHAVKTIHVYAGLLLPLPLLIGLLLPSGRQFRRDLSRINRWTADDRRWWKRRDRATVQLGKFNPGQKLNAIFVGSATFVHDWVFITLVVVIVGHIMFAFSDFDSLRSMVRGWVPEQWARRERPRWWAEVVAARSDAAKSGNAGGDVETGREERVGEPSVRAGEMPVGD
jgi:formate dehydrogenase subunit gamma